MYINRLYYHCRNNHFMLSCFQDIFSCKYPLIQSVFLPIFFAFFSNSLTWHSYVSFCSYSTVSHSCKPFYIKNMYLISLYHVKDSNVCPIWNVSIISQHTQPQWILKKIFIDSCLHSTAHIHNCKNINFSRKPHYKTMY